MRLSISVNAAPSLTNIISNLRTLCCLTSVYPQTNDVRAHSVSRFGAALDLLSKPYMSCSTSEYPRWQQVKYCNSTGHLLAAGQREGTLVECSLQQTLDLLGVFGVKMEMWHGWCFWIWLDRGSARLKKTKTDEKWYTLYLRITSEDDKWFTGRTFCGDTEVREPGGPTVHPPSPPPPPPGTIHYGLKMYLRVSRTQSHLFPGQPLGCTGVIALCARVPSCVHPGNDWAQVTNASFESLVHYCFVT